MAKNYTYPRVAISSTAKVHSSVQPPVADTTVMFVPLVTEKGPHKEIVRIHSLPEFISIFGSLNYERNGQQALNVYNWLRNGGTCYVYRMAGYEGQEKAIISKSSSSIWSDTVTYAKNVKRISSTLQGIDSELTADTYFIIDGINTVIYRDSNHDIPEVIRFINAPSKFSIKTAATGNYCFVANAVVTEDEKTKTTTIKPVESGEDEYDLKNVFFVVKKGDSPDTQAVALSYIEKKDINSNNNDERGKAKYFGKYYNNLSISVKILNHKKDDDGNIRATFNINVIETAIVSASQTLTTIVETFPRRNLENYKTSLVNSDFIDLTFDITKDIKAAINNDETELTYYFKDANDAGIDTDLDALPLFWGDSVAGPSVVLGNPIETPIDIMFDAGYPLSIKQAMMAFINNNGSGTRPDIVGIFDVYELKTIEKRESESATKVTGYLEPPIMNDWSEFNNDMCVATNIALYDQYFMISDEMFTGQNIFVTPTYFLSKLIAYNDMNYGIQFPTAGIRRGVLDDAEAIYNNPTADEKEAMFTTRINYVEKTPREYAFMCQRTHDNSSEESYTALSFLNNIRVLEKMKKEIERLGRNYLFEFNDSITLSNLSSILNKYVMNWIANRTLASGVVTVAKNPWSDEAVDVSLTIKFNGTIEVISVDITIE